MSAGAGMPPAVLVGLTAAVLAAHLWLLDRGAPPIRAALAVRTAPFVTRGIDPPRPAAAARSGASPAAPRSVGGPPVLPASPWPRPGTAQARRPSAMPDPAARSTPDAVPPQAAAAAAPAGQVRVSIPEPMHLRYQVTAYVKQQTSQGSSVLEWHHDGLTYEARFEVAAPQWRPRVQHSTGLLGGEGLAPSRFGDRHRGEQAAHFDREGRRVVFSNNRPAASLAAGAQDRLSVLLQLAALAAGSPDSFSAGASVVVQTATTRDAEEWVFTVEGEEQLRLPGGDLAALKLTRPARGEFDQRLEVWLAPGQAYVPVRLRLTQPNGDWVDHQWSATDSR